jgi:hypothetical protein
VSAAKATFPCKYAAIMVVSGGSNHLQQVGVGMPSFGPEKQDSENN